MEAEKDWNSFNQVVTNDYENKQKAIPMPPPQSPPTAPLQTERVEQFQVCKIRFINKQFIMEKEKKHTHPLIDTFGVNNTVSPTYEFKNTIQPTPQNLYHVPATPQVSYVAPPNSSNSMNTRTSLLDL